MKQIISTFLIVISIHFWGYIGIPQDYFKYTDLFTLLIFFISFFVKLQDKTLFFRNAIICYFIGILLNIISAYFNNGQVIKDTALSMGYFYFIFLYFFLNIQKVSPKYLEFLVIVLGGLYSIFYLLQYNSFPERLFAGNLFAERGTIRMRIEGASFMVLAYFLLMNKFMLKRNPFYLLLAFFFLYILLRGGYRSFSLAAILLTGVLFVRLVKYSPVNYFLILVVVILFMGMLQSDTTSRVIRGMVTASKQQQRQGERYIRFMQLEYFTEEYPQNFSYYLLGGGFPGAYGNYSRRMDLLCGRYGFYWVDLGLLGFYLVVGLVALIGLLWWIIKATFARLPAEYYYLNMYFAFLFLASTIIMDEIYAKGIFVVQAVGLYLIDAARKQKAEENLSTFNKLQ